MLELTAGAPLDPRGYRELVHRAVFECCKWNLAAYDTPSICRFPIAVSSALLETWYGQAEALAAEAARAEEELLRRPELWEVIGIPESVARHFAPKSAAGAVRYLRFDFHPVADGFRITEGNTDVAGGLLECSGLGALWQELGSGELCGDPAGALAATMRSRLRAGSTVGIMHLTRYTDDHQVASYLGRRFEREGLRAVLFDARQLRPELRAVSGEGTERLDAVFRFFPGDWLLQLPDETGWQDLVRSPAVCNPVSTLLTQSKRFPLTWDRLSAPFVQWRTLLPETVEPEHANFGEPWVLKPAFGHEGDRVFLPSLTTDMASVRRKVLRKPREWIAQRCFELTPLETPDGPRYVCVGVFVIDGRAEGAYARVSRTALIDAAAQDAVVIREDA